MGGLRVALSVGVPGPWGEGAKNILHVKGLAYVPVAQYPTMPNPELEAWTGVSNAPVAVGDDGKARSGWAEILMLAEDLAPEPRLIPEAPEERAAMFGLAHEICAPDGLGWCRRLMLVDALRRPEAGEMGSRAGAYLGDRYGYGAVAAARAPRRVAEVLGLLSRTLAAQHRRGQRFLVGSALSAVDLYWAAFAVLLRPLPSDLCPMPEYLHAWYADVGPVVAPAMDDALFEHRDRIYRDYLELPMRF